MSNIIHFKGWKTVSIYVVIAGVGISLGVFGSTMPNLEILLDTNTETLGMSLSFQAGGNLLGSLTCGAFFERFSKELQFILICILSSLSLLLAPIFKNMICFIIMMSVAGICRGFLCTACGPYVLMLWKDNHYQSVFIHAVHLMLCIGSTLSPFIIQPFLTHVPVVNQTNQIQILNGSFYNTYSNCSIECLTNSQDINVDKVIFAYVFISIFAAIGFVLFAIIYCHENAFLKSRENDQNNSANKQDIALQSVSSKIEIPKSNQLKIGLLIFSFVIFGLHVSVECLVAYFLSILSVKGFSWSIYTGSLLTSLFWGGLCLGRFLALPLSLYISPSVLLNSGLLINGIGFILLLFTESLGKTGAIVGTILAGLGSGPFYGCIMSWLSQYIAFTGFVSAICATGFSVGEISFTALTGYMIQEYGAMWLIYICISGNVLVLLTFISMIVFVKCNGNLKNDSNNSNQSMESSSHSDASKQSMIDSHQFNKE